MLREGVAFKKKETTKRQKISVRKSEELFGILMVRSTSRTACIVLFGTITVSKGYLISQRCSSGSCLYNRGHTRSSRLYNSDFLTNPYADLLNFDKPVDESIAAEMKDEMSIDQAIEEAGVPRVGLERFKSKKIATRKWERWDAFMEEELGDIEAEPSEKDAWILDAREAVEQKRGFAIWSKRSDKDIATQVRKDVTNKQIKAPEAFSRIVKCVYLEKTHGMKDMRIENELNVINFRKWMAELSKKLKKNPLPVVKTEVSQRWLLEHPASSARRSGVDPSKPPAVIMDELREPVAGVKFETRKASNLRNGEGGKEGATASGQGGPAGKSSTQSTRVVTGSMINWEKSQEEMPKREHTPSSATKKSTAAENKIVLGGEEMFCCTGAGDDYFVLL